MLDLCGMRVEACGTRDYGASSFRSSDDRPVCATGQHLSCSSVKGEGSAKDCVAFIVCPPSQRARHYLLRSAEGSMCPGKRCHLKCLIVSIQVRLEAASAVRALASNVHNKRILVEEGVLHGLRDMMDLNAPEAKKRASEAIFRYGPDLHAVCARTRVRVCLCGMHFNWTYANITRYDDRVLEFHEARFRVCYAPVLDLCRICQAG